MHAVRQKCRSRHKVLVLKCYPKFQKNVQEVKPNSSELSYLLYYVSTRRSKLQKVGLFLEHRTASDVSRLRLGNVQVTLQILTALIEKAPRDLPLYSESVLNILETVLMSKDINMIEESLSTFESFCIYQDASSLASDQYRSQQYQNIVQMYADFASPGFLSSFPHAPSKPMDLRWKTAGLRAIRNVVGAEALGADGMKQLSIVIPVILDNLFAGDDDILAFLQEKVQTGEKADVENARRRRMSIATVNTVDTVDATLASASRTTEDADKAAEDEVRVLSVRCLKQIFAAGTGSNRGQVRLATILTLRFIAARDSPVLGLADPSSRSGRSGNWATSLVETIARWTPVQDQFIIVITAVDALITNSVEESELEQQLTLATMIDWLLSSSINLIGLSVMDVMLGFVQHVLNLLQLGGRGFLHTGGLEDGAQVAPKKEKAQIHTTNALKPSPVRQHLLLWLQRCIGDLATHIYYTDQISDMVSAILARLKPSTHSDVSSAAAAIEHPVAAANAIANSVNLREDPLSDGFFSFATARLTALRVVKDILQVANLRNSVGAATTEARSRVGIQVWEGTQWLLRDEDRKVRVAYVDAILTWLTFETNTSHLFIFREGPRNPKTTSRRGPNENGEVKLAKRAISNASKKEKKITNSNFLQLLHLAVYESATETPQIDSDILLLHLLLTTLTERLGVNAVRYGLPMISRLQDDLQSSHVSGHPRAKINLGSLVHGYLWALSETFGLETNRVGIGIQSEISRRKSNGLWMEKIRVPTIPLDQIVASSTASAQEEPIVPDTITVSLEPYKSRSDLVEEICTSYHNSLITPATPPPSSPGRVFSVPGLSFGHGCGVNPVSKPLLEDQLPPKVRDELLAEWSKDSAIAAVESACSDSLSGSRAGTGSATAGRKFLAVNGVNGAGGHSRGSPGVNDTPNQAVNGGGPRISSAMFYALNGGLGNLQRLQKAGTDGGSPASLTASSSRDSIVRVTELKRVLSGYAGDPRHSSPLRRPMTGLTDGGVDSAKSRGSSESGSDGDGDGDGDGDSIMSYNEVAGGADRSTPDLSAVDRVDFAPPTAITCDHKEQDTEAEYARPRSSSWSSSPSRHLQRRGIDNGIHAATTLPRSNSDPRLGQDIPPVPKIPSSLNLPRTFPQEGSPARSSSSEAAHRHHQPRHRSTKAPAIPRSPTAPTTGPSSSSVREGRSLLRRQRSTRAWARPATSDGGDVMNRESRGEVWDTQTTTTTTPTTPAELRKERRKDLNRLLKGIRVDLDDDDDTAANYAGAMKAGDGFHVSSNGVDLGLDLSVGVGNGNGNGNGNHGTEPGDLGSAASRGGGRAGPNAIVAIRPPY